MGCIGLAVISVEHGKYFQHPPPNNWWFHAKVRNGNKPPSYFRIFRLATVKIERHVKIRAQATPFDPAYFGYFDQRKKRRSKKKQAGGGRTPPKVPVAVILNNPRY